MIARKITYKGNFGQDSINSIYDIARKIEITGEVKVVSPQEVILNLEGDPSMIKLLQHQIEHKVKKAITSKSVEQIPYQYYVGINFLAL